MNLLNRDRFPTDFLSNCLGGLTDKSLECSTGGNEIESFVIIESKVPSNVPQFNANN